MADLAKFLKSKFKGSRRIAVLGVGSEFREDDAAGMLAANSLLKLLKRKPKKSLKIFLGATAPENLTGEVRRYKPSHVVIIDAADISQPTGTILALDPDEIDEGVTFSTHKMPAKVLAEYFIKTTGCKIIVIGIQPGSVKFGRKPSKKVTSAAKFVAETIFESI